MSSCIECREFIHTEGIHMDTSGNEMDVLSNKHAFTLIELIVVMAIIAILVLLAAPRFLGYTKDANVTAVIQDRKVLADAVGLYHVDNEEYPINKDDFTTAYSIGMGGASEIYPLPEGILKKYVKNTTNDPSEYGVAIGGKYDGQVFHLGSEVRKDVYDYGLFGKEDVQKWTDTDMTIEDNGDIELTVRGSLSGLYIINDDKVNMKQNTTYILSYDYQKIDGNLLSFGGHTGGNMVSNSKLYVDGELVDKVHHDHDSVYTGNDMNEHSVVFIFETGRNLKTGNHFNANGLWIQPNRQFKETATVKIRNLMLLEYTND